MARKTKAQAEKNVERHIDASWRFLLRNTKFQRNIDFLHKRQKYKHSTPKSYLKHKELIADRWGVLLIPGKLLNYWPGYPLEAEDYPMLEYYLRSYPGSIVDYSPVTTTELLDDRFLFLRVDLKHPLQDILPLTEEAIREATNGRLRKRQRLDKVDEQLTVYDSAFQGVPFKKIASKLNLRVSTVKSIYIAAGLKIYGKNERPNKKQLETELLMADFDSDTHTKNCTICSTAETTKQMCQQAQYYSNQDYGSQRESLGLDTTRI